MATSRIFVRGLPPSITEAEFRKHFSANNREITDVKLIPQRRIGYVGYKTADDASKAVKYFNKSYVRMSKIAVEPAKAISDPTLPKSRVGIRSAAPLPHQKAQGEQADAESGSKKRKRDVPGQDDAKFQEYLRVIGNSREAPLADIATAQAGDVSTSVPVVEVPEGESDGEYDEIPARKEKQRRLEAPGKAPAGAALVVPVPENQDVEKGMDSPQGETGPEPEQPQNTEAEDQPAATDDDWLRSRTSRLLDLMDPDEIEAPGAPETDSKPPPEKKVPDSEPSPSEEEKIVETETNDAEAEEETSLKPIDTIRRTSRLFIRNLPYSVTEDDIRDHMEQFGDVEEVHIPTNKAGTGKGFALVLFSDSSHAVEAYETMDGTTFQGRILHIIPADAKRDSGLNEYELSKLPLKKQNMIRKKAEAASNTFNWNSLFMNQDAVNASVASRLGVSKSEMLDPTSSDAAVKQAIAESTVIQETKAYFLANGVDLDAFKSHKRGDTGILVKNFPYGTTIDELRSLFEESGPVSRVLMPQNGTIAIVQFSQANHAKTAFGKLAYRRIKDSVLFLEKAPKNLFTNEAAGNAPPPLLPADRPTGTQKLSVNDLLSSGDKAEQEIETSSLFVRNLNFDTTTSRLAETFESLDGFISARVKTKMDPKKPGRTLSMGFGFVEFKSKNQAHEALKVMDGHVLDGHSLTVKASHRGLDAAEERRRDDKAKKVAGQRTKIIIKNLPFQATKKDIRALFGTYGQLRSVRVPKKADFTTRGFAFADFVTPREAENALNALKDTHLLGRKMVLDFAEAEALDAEEEIEKMQRKVGGQVNRMALQKLTGEGRKKVNLGNEDEEGFE